MSPLRSGPEIPLPADQKDIGRFLKDVLRHPAYQEVDKRLKGLAASCPNGEAQYWSVFRHKSDGKWSAERRALHEALVATALAGKRRVPKGVKPLAVLLIGTPGSGKTSEGMKHVPNSKEDFVVINADDVKESLPEYRGWNAGALHEESSYVAEKLIFSAAVDNRHHIIFDLTGANGIKMLGMVDDLDGLGYEIHVILVKIPAWMAAGRVWDRFCKVPFDKKSPSSMSGRFVPPEYAYNIVDDRPANTYSLLKQHEAVKSWTSISTEKKPAQVLEQDTR